MNGDYGARSCDYVDPSSTSGDGEDVKHTAGSFIGDFYDDGGIKCNYNVDMAVVEAVMMINWRTFPDVSSFCAKNDNNGEK